MKNVLFTLLLSCTFALSSAQAQTFEWIDCNSVEVGVANPSPGPICGNCYGPTSATAQFKMYARFDVYRKNANGTRTFEKIRMTPYSSTYEFNTNFLSSGVDYEIDVFYATKLDGVCYQYSNTPIGGCIGQWTFQGTTQVFSFGNISHNWSVTDASGTSGNNVYCLSDLQANGGPFIVGGLSGEAEWSVNVCLVNPNNSSNCLAWTSTYWQTGVMPNSVDILNDVWKLHHSSWTLWYTNDYRVTVVGRKDNCSGWNSVDYNFTVVKNGCRLLETEQIGVHVYPNPTTNWIKLETEGWLIPSYGTNYQIVDMSGCTVLQGKLMSDNDQIYTNELASGLYILQLDVEDERINKRFTVVNN